MAARRYRKLAILAKIEETYAHNVSPTGASNAMQMTDVTVTPLEGEQVSRDLMLPHFGDQGFILAASYMRVEGSVELAGSGQPGTPPACGPLLRACGLAEVVTPGQKVEYVPVSDAQESANVYANLDGTNHVMTGSRGSFSFTLAPKQIPRFRFNFWGLLGGVDDTLLPQVNLSRFADPLVASRTNSAFSLFGGSRVLESFSFNLGNQVEPRMLIGRDSMLVVDRKCSGSAVIEAGQLSERDWFGEARAGAKGPLFASHGTAAGNIVEFAATRVQIGRPTYGNTQNILNYTLPLTFTPSQGDDEFTLRFR